MPAIRPHAGPRRPPYLSTLLAGTCVLTLLGVFSLALLEGRALVTAVRESVAVVIELRPGTQATDRDAFSAWLSGQPFLKPGSVVYIDREAGARLLAADLGEDLLDYQLENPLRDVFTVNLREEFVTPAQIVNCRNAIAARTAVLDVVVQEDLVRALATRLEGLSWIGASFGLLLLAGVAFLVLNTTRLALQAQAGVIRNMELVGASWGFISRPFLTKATLHGLLSGVSAAGLTLAVGYSVFYSWPALWVAIPTPQLIALSLWLLVLAISLNFAATFVIVRQTLKLR